MTPSALPLPPDFLAAQAALLGPDLFRRWVDGVTAPRATVFRLNPLRGDTDAARRALVQSGVDMIPAGLAPETWLTTPGHRGALLAHPMWREGRVLVQGLSSIAAVRSLDPQPGERILDLCAAPGGKTSYIAALLAGRGEVVANDISVARTHRMRRLLAQLGAPATIRTGPGERFGTREVGGFDRVLVDAPCSGDAALRPDDPPACSAWKPGRHRGLAPQQKRLLHAAIACTRPGGVIVYATCTFAPEENEAVIARALERYPAHVALEPLPVDPPDAVPAAGLEGAPTGAARRVVPVARETALGRLVLTEGFFVARLRRTDRTWDRASG